MVALGSFKLMKNVMGGFKHGCSLEVVVLQRSLLEQV